MAVCCSSRGSSVPNATLYFGFLVSLLLLLSCRTTAKSKSNTTATTGRGSMPALIVFGDSIVDPGNNNALLTTIKCNFLPYGMDFGAQGPTGRFSNGKIPSDLMASQLGIKDYLPAYLDNNLTSEDLLTGVSFASGGTGFDPLTPTIVSALSMKDQLELFKEYREKVKNIVGEKKAAWIISESAYLACAGTDDIANTYFTTTTRSPYYDIPSYVDLMVKSAAHFMQELISLGARKIAFVGLPPIGCLPSQRTNGGGIKRKCEPFRNRAAKLFNTQIDQVLEDIQTKHNGTTIVFLGTYDIMMDFIENPSDYGYVEVAKGCCGTGDVEVTLTCDPFTPICSDHTQYIFWDSYHPTEKTYRILLDKLKDKNPFSR